MSADPTGYKISVEEKCNRLLAAVTALATESDRLAEECREAGVKIEPRMSMEEQVERILHVEAFTWTCPPQGGVW